jgi:hypothetical protein
LTSGSHDELRGGGDAEPAADGIPFRQRHGGFREFMDRLMELGLEREELGAALGRLRMQAVLQQAHDVGADSEVLLLSAEHEGLHPRVRARPLDQRDELLDLREREGVVPLLAP